jgi:hypothetical protein
MNADSNETEPDRRALAISVWENEGGVRAPGTPDGQFGRRVEMDRSWTIYHVLTGIPARVDGAALTDLSRQSSQRQASERPEHPAEIGLEGSQTSVSIMTLAFPNPSRSFDEARNAVLFFGHDGVSEIRFFVEAGALARSGTALPMSGMSEAKCLQPSTPCARPFWRSRERRILTDAGITTLLLAPSSTRGGGGWLYVHSVFGRNARRLQRSAAMRK